MKKIWCLLLGLVIFLYGCQRTPDIPSVISKNNGLFEGQTAKEMPESAGEAQTIQCTESFASTDGGIMFSWNINQAINVSSKPVIEVVPHFLAGEEVERVAHAVCGNVNFYEMEHENQKQFSKDELRDMIEMLSQYANPEAYGQLEGRKDERKHFQHEIERLNEMILDYTEMMESAPVENPHCPCEWRFRPEADYFDGRENVDRLIRARVNLDGRKYILNAVTRNEPDFKLNGITLSLGCEPMEKKIYRAELCRGGFPTEEQMRLAAEKAQEILDRIDLGKWEISGVDILKEKAGTIEEYEIQVKMVPVLEGYSALEGQRIGALNGENTYASNYYMTSAFFNFSSDGILTYFALTSPVDVQRVVNPSPATMSLKDLMDRIQSQLSLCDQDAYFGLASREITAIRDHLEEEILCRVSITGLEYGLARVKVKDSENAYYYLPAITCIGDVEYYGKTSGMIYTSNDLAEGESVHLLWLNAIDGSVITQ